MTWRHASISQTADRLEKRCAHYEVRRAVGRGLVSRGECEVCGSEHRVHGHHTDHLDRLSVWWLCAECHAKMHRGTLDAVPDRALPDPRSFVAWRHDFTTDGHGNIDDELRTRIELGLSLLGDKYRHAVIQRVINGRTLLEVGNSLGVTRERARQMVAKGLSRIRDVVGHQYADNFRQDAPAPAGRIAPALTAESEAA